MVNMFPFLTMNMQSLMVSESLDTTKKLQTALILAEVFVSALSKETPYHQFEPR